MGQRWIPQQQGPFQNQQNFQNQQRVQNQHVPSPQHHINPSVNPNGGVAHNPNVRNQHQEKAQQIQGNPQQPPQIKREPDEEQQRVYKEKLRRLQRYIEPLNRMIRRNESNQTVPQINNSATKVRAIILGQEIHNIEVLDKVEAFCKHQLENQQQADYAPKNNNNHPCQALLDVVIAHISKPNINHTLSRTFKPVMDKVRPDPAPFSLAQTEELQPSARKHKVPLILQGEVASLDKKFYVRLNDSSHNAKGDIHIVVELNDPTLPPVRPLYITIPADYPNISPIVENTDDNMDQHMIETLEEGTDFITTQQLIFHERQYSLGSHVVTLTQVLSGWELSIRQAMARANIDFAQQKLKEYEETHIIEDEHAQQHIMA